MWKYPIYGISIRKDRKERFLKRLGTLRKYVKGIHGVNGITLKPRQGCAPGCKLRRGQIGCFFSHRQIWRRMLAANHPIACVFEDDVTFYAHFPQRVIQAIKYLNRHQPKWDVLYLGRNYKKRKNLKKVGPGLVVPGYSWGMFAYIISHRGARKLLKHKHTQQLRVPCDVLLANLGLQGYLNNFALFPCACGYLTLGSDTNRIR
uniref:Glycosyl transferase family 25 domain-containing protein n=1 Tax=viral metagenome TaxID=1070528 RepID=A0A6C0BQN9_9ZZZZ